jgi:hypothetical protein
MESNENKIITENKENENQFPPQNTMGNSQIQNNINQQHNQISFKKPNERVKTRVNNIF